MMLRTILLGVILTLSPPAANAQQNAQPFLISIEDGRPTAQLAKSWRKVSDQEYEFVLDTSQEVARGRPVTAEFVKSSLEARLGQTHGVSVKEKSESVVVVSFRGDEMDFLRQISQTRIRARRNVELALESSVSSGGLRANKIARGPENGEVKATFVSIDNGIMTVFVVQLGQEGVPPAIRPSRQVRIRVPNPDALGKLNRDDDLFFQPVRFKDNVWQVKSVYTE